VEIKIHELEETKARLMLDEIIRRNEELEKENRFLRKEIVLARTLKNKAEAYVKHLKKNYFFRKKSTEKYIVLKK
jgi:hypothetical protein